MENIPGGGGVPFFLSSNLSLVTRHWTQVLSFHILPHSFARFCIHAKFNPFLFKRFRTLCQEKTRGVGAESKNGGALPAVMGASAERAYRLQERRSSTVLRSPRMLLRFSLPVAEAAEVHSSGISPDALAQWCSPRAPRTASSAVPSAGCSSACTWYCQNGDPNACS